MNPFDIIKVLWSFLKKLDKNSAEIRLEVKSILKN